MTGVIKVSAGLLAGASLMTSVVPVVGEAIATRPPLFPKARTGLPAEEGLAYEDVAFTTDDGLTLRGWFLPGKEADSPAVVYSHATGHDQRSGFSLVPALHQAGYHVLRFSYRGHALSEGRRGGGNSRRHPQPGGAPTRPANHGFSQWSLGCGHPSPV